MKRRSFLLGSSAAVAAGSLPTGFAIGQADKRPAVRVAVQRISTSNTLEPLREVSNVGQRFGQSIAEGLLQVDWAGDLSVAPALAESWTRIDDRTLELTLRTGATFHDGTTVDAEAVAFSFGRERMWGTRNVSVSTTGMFSQNTAGIAGKEPPAEVSASARRFFPGFERIEVTGARTLRFIMTRADPALEARLTRYGASIHSPKAFAAAAGWLDWARRPVGSGPYMVGTYRPETSLQLLPHDNHWAGRPPLRELTFIEVPDVSARVAGLLAGDWEFACDLPPDQIAAVERNPRFEVQGGLVTNHRLTVFDKSHPQLVDPRIRRAFTHSVDRRTIVEALWAGRTSVPQGMQWKFFGDLFQSDWQAPEFNPAEAKRLLKEAGYKSNPIPYQVLNNYYTAQVPTAQVLVEGWRQVGLNVEITMKENFSETVARSPNRAVRDNSNTAFFPDPSGAMEAFGPDGQQAGTGEWQNAEADQMLAVLSTNMDRDKRRAAFRRMLEICEREDPAYTVLHQTANFTAKRRDIPWRAWPTFAMDFSAKNWQQ